MIKLSHGNIFCRFSVINVSYLEYSRVSEKVLLLMIEKTPAIFMTAVVVTYLLTEPNLALGRYIPYNIALFAGLE